MKTAVLLLALVALAHADMYLHNMRGSNNRLDEARRDRNNANRMFDSQNNNRGGYNVGSLYYYTGSILSLEWTNQHSCSDQNNHCEQVLQYMCDDLIRDGTTTSTIPENPANCEDWDCNNDIEYGMHESFDYYVDCKLRQRNTGLFIADRNLRGETARYTRQNENGNRYAYECPEERDYYPYWHPTPWRDIVVFTNDATRCVLFQRESQNVKSRFACVLPSGYLTTARLNSRRAVIPNTQEACEAIISETGNGTWQEFPPDPRLSAPECVETHWSRDNHLGNTLGGYPINYNWTIPDIPHEHCVLRIRYNISTAEYDGWDGSTTSQVQQVSDIVLDGATTNGNAQTRRRTISNLTDVYTQFGFDYDTALERGYVFRQNPVVKVFPDSPGTPNNFGLQLAINTNQFGRTFQDRSHSFAIRERPADLEGATIYNLNVRGKRGNIVQVYPAVEYDFVPNVLIMSADSYVHIQWTGSNTNPNNNDGQGRAGTDRSNIVLLRGPNYEEGNGDAVASSPAIGHWGNSYPTHLDDNITFLGLSREDRQSLATLDNIQYGGEMSELDDAGTYFDLGPRKITQRGTFYYMCSRNNNFTNRSQKGKIIVQDNALGQKRIGWSGGTVEVDGNSLQFNQGSLNTAMEFRMDQFPNASSVEETFDISTPSGGRVSSFVLVTPTTRFTDSSDGGMGMIAMPIDPSIASSDNIQVLRANAATDWNFVALDTRVEDDMAYADTSSGGIFVVNGEVNAGLVAGIVVAVLIVLVIGLTAGAVVLYFVIRRDKWQKTKDNVRKAKTKVTRSFAKQV